MVEHSRPFSPEDSPEHESALRRMMADAAGLPYRAFPSLAEARQAPDAVVVLEGDDGGQIYLVAPIRQVRCTEEALRQLLHDLDAQVWDAPDMAHLRFEAHAVGEPVPGGKGGGRVEEGLWIHPEFQPQTDEVAAVLGGARSRISLGAG
jgi:hypothetical protein